MRTWRFRGLRRTARSPQAEECVCIRSCDTCPHQIRDRCIHGSYHVFHLLGDMVISDRDEKSPHMLSCTRIHRAVSPRGLGSNLDLKADRSKGTLGAQQYNHNNIPSSLFLELSTVNNTSDLLYRDQPLHASDIRPHRLPRPSHAALRPSGPVSSRVKTKTKRNAQPPNTHLLTYAHRQDTLPYHYIPFTPPSFTSPCYIHPHRHRPRRSPPRAHTPGRRVAYFRTCWQCSATFIVLRTRHDNTAQHGFGRGPAEGEWRRCRSLLRKQSETKCRHTRARREHAQAWREHS
jgi:hypothetical protein